MKKIIYNEFKHLFFCSCASVLWALAYNMVIIPNEFAANGLSGIMVIINYLFGLSMGIQNLLFNIPLLLISYKLLGKKFVLRTLVSVTVFSVMLDYVVVGVTPYTADPLMASILSGVLCGIGSAVVFMCASSGGGTEILMKLIKIKYPHISLGQMMLFINVFVMGLSGIVFNSLESMLYGLVNAFVTGQVMDIIMNGTSVVNSVTIMTKNPQPISESIIANLRRSATIVNGEGAYSKEGMSVMFCVVRKSELQKLKELVYTADPNAFIVISEAKQVVGKSFINRALVD